MSTQMDPQWKAYYAALEVARSSPVGALLDDLALSDLVNIEMRVPRDSKNEHALKTMECCALAREAKVSMKANYWLRQAMAYFKDFMLWDAHIRGLPFINQSGKKEPKPKTKLYEKYAALYPGDNKNAAQKLRDACESDAECMALFFWRDRELIERENGKRILIDNMVSQIQKARERMKKRGEKKT